MTKSAPSHLLTIDIEPAPRDQFPLDDRSRGLLVMGEADREAQLWAIRELVRRLRHEDKETSQRIQRIEAQANHPSWNNRDVDDLIDHYYTSGFQHAAHSMSVIAMLAPFIESMFKEAFTGIRLALESRDQLPSSRHGRWQMEAAKQWDCRYKSVSARPDLVGGILELADAIDVARDFPVDLASTLRALFAYRNRMFHWGFEWPQAQRLAFAALILSERWPAEWFPKWTRGNEPVVFYLSEAFVDHCLGVIDSVIVGVGRYLDRNGW